MPNSLSLSGIGIGESLADYRIRLWLEGQKTSGGTSSSTTKTPASVGAENKQQK